ncbi:MAG: hypothetical protein ACRD5M_14700 [Candidatus Acidiferrales bacterium]
MKAHTILLAAIVAAGLVGLGACGSGASSTGATVTSVVLTLQSASVPINTSTNVTAQVNTSSNSVITNTAVTWFVNGVAGGNSTVGTIVPSTTSQQVGLYTAPAVVPAENNGQVNITATAPQDPSNSTDTKVITSNTVVATITAGEGLLVSPAGQTVPAGGNFQFTATLNSVPDPNAKWTATSTNGGDLGMIDVNSGLYTAPLAPPPGQMVTITANDHGITATAVATIVYSDASLNGPFAFSYSGGAGTNFVAVAGSFVADGQGSIVSGVEDIENFSTGISVQVPIQNGSYLVSRDGRTRVSLNTGGQAGSTLQFALMSTQHALMIRFDQNAVASGTVDQQDLNALTNSNSVISGPYVFGVAGEDLAKNTMGVAGKFSASGTGTISATNTIFDVNDGGTVTTPTSAPTSSVSLMGVYGFDPAFPGTGRGTMTLTLTTHTSTNNSNAQQQLEFAFYVVDSTHLRLVEIDHNALLSGDVFGAPAGNSFNAGSLAMGNYVLTSSGSSSAGAYAAGGVFASDGAGNVSGGALDTNNAGTPGATTTIAACAYSVDGTTGRVDLKLFTGAGACPGGANASTSEFSMYQTTQGSAVILEIDANAISSGLAYHQAASPVALTGSFATSIAGQGTAQNLAGAIPQDAVGQLTLAGASVTSGTIDINNFNAVFTGDPVSTTSTIAAPDTNGRAAAMLKATNPTVTFTLMYYVIDANRALMLDLDTTRVGTGAIARQF